MVKDKLDIREWARSIKWFIRENAFIGLVVATSIAIIIAVFVIGERLEKYKHDGSLIKGAAKGMGELKKAFDEGVEGK